MEFNVQIDGLDRIHKASARVREEISKELVKGLFVSAKRVEGDAKKSILNGKKSGREYTRGSVTHRASAPGQAPASDTGRLVNSINGDLDRGNKSATIRVAAKYGKPLEFGTSKIAARPFLFPALEKNKKWIAERLNKGLVKAIIRVSKK